MFSNCSTVAQPAQRAQRDLKILVGTRRRRADHAGGHLHVLLANGLHHVAGRQVAHAQLHGVDPDAHAVIALAEQVDVAHAFDARQFVLDLHQSEVAQVQLVVATFLRGDRDAHQNVGRSLLHRHAGLPDHFRQRRQSQAHAVLHQHLGHVQIDAVLERDGQAVGAVVGASSTTCTACPRRRSLAARSARPPRWPRRPHWRRERHT